MCRMGSHVPRFRVTPGPVKREGGPLHTCHPSRDPRTGWWCYSTGAGGANQYSDVCQAEACSGTQFNREVGATPRTHTQAELGPGTHAGCTRSRLPQPAPHSHLPAPRPAQPHVCRFLQGKTGTCTVFGDVHLYLGTSIGCAGELPRRAQLPPPKRSAQKTSPSSDTARVARCSTSIWPVRRPRQVT